MRLTFVCHRPPTFVITCSARKAGLRSNGVRWGVALECDDGDFNGVHGYTVRTAQEGTRRIYDSLFVATSDTGERDHVLRSKSMCRSNGVC